VEVADASLALAQAYMQLFRGSSTPATAEIAPHSNSSSNLQESTSGAPVQQASSISTPFPVAGPEAVAISKPIQPGSIRELAAARMHLRGVLKQCEPVFGEHAKWQALSVACADVTAAEGEARVLADT